MKALVAVLLLPRVAAAWNPGPLEHLPTPAPVEHIAAVRIDELDLLIAGMGHETGFFTLGGAGVATISAGMRDYALIDADADGGKEIILCGPEGVAVVEPRGFAARVELDVPCDAVEAVIDPEHGPVLAVGAGRLYLLAPSEEGLREVAVVGNFMGNARLAAAGSRWVSADTARPHVERRERSGGWTAPGPVGDVISGPLGFTWSVPDQGLIEDETGVRWLSEGRPEQLRAADLDRDGVRDLVSVHPDTQQIGVTAGRGGATELVRFADGPSSVFVRDFNRDGCDDLAVGFRDNPGLAVLVTKPCSARPIVASGVVPEAAPDRIPPPAARERGRLLGVPVPSFLGSDNVLPFERRRWQTHVLVGSGWAAGATLSNTWFEVPFFPALSVEFEFGGPRVRGFVGGDSAALFFWVGDRGRGIHLANLTAGMTFGSPRLRTGPFVTGGIWNVGAGLRTVFTPWEDGWETTKGIELRLTWFYQDTGEVMLLYVWSEPGRGSERRALPPDPDIPILPGWQPLLDEGTRSNTSRSDLSEPALAEPARHRVVGCRRFSASLGAAVGASSTRFSWDFVGSDVNIRPSASPILSLACEGGGPVAAFASVETAPLFTYTTREDRNLRQIATHSLGLMFGGDRARTGPIVTGGIWQLGGGLRGVVQVGRGRGGAVHQLELRALALYPSAPSGQVVLMYGGSFDPF